MRWTDSETTRVLRKCKSTSPETQRLEQQPDNGLVKHGCAYCDLTQ